MPKPLLLVGLGNPGARFVGTRHNVGFDLITLLGQTLGLSLRRPLLRRNLAWSGPGRQQPQVLATPLTYMNRSGAVLPWLMRRAGVDASRTLVLVDNMDLPPGEIRMKERGKPASHNGLKSVSAALGGDDYPRLYIGVGRPPAGDSIIEHVLGHFSPADRERVDAALERAASVLAAPPADMAALISAVNAQRRPG